MRRNSLVQPIIAQMCRCLTVYCVSEGDFEGAYHREYRLGKFEICPINRQGPRFVAARCGQVSAHARSRQNGLKIRKVHDLKKMEDIP